MKHLLLMASLFFIFNVYAETVDGEEGRKYVPPTDSEISANRSCFQELERQGCRSLEEDPEQFRSCLSNTHLVLDEHCKQLMIELYGTKE